MEIKESIRAGLKELILPEIGKVREENAEIKTILTLTIKRLDDINVHLADQSRRIDETNKRIDSVREELCNRIDSVREELGNRIDAVHEKLGNRIDAFRDELGNRIDAVREELGLEIRETNKRLDRLFEIIVRREEHAQVVQRLTVLEREVAEIKQKLAA